MSIPPEEERFATNLSGLIETLKEGVVKLNSKGFNSLNPWMIDIASSVIQGQDKKLIIERFIKHAHENMWDKISERSESYFKTDGMELIKTFIPLLTVNIFQEFFDKKDDKDQFIISEQFKNTIWSFFDSLVKISITYVHKGRDPYSFEENGKIVRKYDKTYFPDVKLKHHYAVWSQKEKPLKLTFPLKNE